MAGAATVETTQDDKAAPVDAAATPAHSLVETVVTDAKSAVESHGLSTGALAGIGGVTGLTAIGGGVAAFLGTHHGTPVSCTYFRFYDTSYTLLMMLNGF